MIGCMQGHHSADDEREQWLRLLGTVTLGRVALTSGALPSVLPVPFRLDGDRIVIRTRPGTKLDAATRDAVVAFQADVLDPVDHSGWSVEVTGVATEVTDPDERARLSELLPPNGSTSALASRFVTISTELVSGQRYGPKVAAYRTPA